MEKRDREMEIVERRRRREETRDENVFNENVIKRDENVDFHEIFMKCYVGCGEVTLLIKEVIEYGL